MFDTVYEVDVYLQCGVSYLVIVFIGVFLELFRITFYAGPHIKEQLHNTICVTQTVA